MSRSPALIIFAAICLASIGAVIVGLMRPEPQLFDSQKLKTAAALDTSLPISIILPEGATTICVFGPYQDPRFFISNIDPELLKQLVQSSVPEGSVRIAVFDRQSELIHEEEIPMRRGHVRIIPLTDGAPFCRAATKVRVKAIENDGYTAIQLFE